MYDDIEIREIVFDAQRKLDRLFPGLKIVVVEQERQITRADVTQALRDRQNAGIDASNEIDYAPRNLDRMLYNSPKWVTSSRDGLATVVSVDEQITPVKKNNFRVLYEKVQEKIKGFFSKQGPKQSEVLSVSKHRNRVPCRTFKDGTTL